MLVALLPYFVCLSCSLYHPPIKLQAKSSLIHTILNVVDLMESSCVLLPPTTPSVMITELGRTEPGLLLLVGYQVVGPGNMEEEQPGTTRRICAIQYIILI